MLFDCAVIIPTVLRDGLDRAVRSVYAQDFAGTVQVLIGIDIAKGDRGILDSLRDTCPERMNLTVVDLGYSTNRRNGGFYPVVCGGALRTILSYAANSPFLAYLDDDNWWAPNHLSTLMEAIRDHAWAHSYRWYVNPDTQEPICVDRWESVGANRGVYAHEFNYNGHVDSNCFMLDKRRCHWLLPAWSIPHAHSKRSYMQGEGGEDRTVFQALQRRFEGACTGQATVYYVVQPHWMGVIKYLLGGHQPPGDVPESEERTYQLAQRMETMAIPDRPEWRSSSPATTGQGDGD